MHLGDVAQMQVIGPACELKGPDAGHRAHVRVREHARGCAASRADRVAVIAIVRGSDGSWARLLAVLTLPCAAKAHWLSSPGFCGGLFRPLPFVLLCVGFLLVAV